MSEDKKTDHLFKPGNQLWKLRSKHGRDKIFATPEIMWEAACEYFKWCDENPFQEATYQKHKTSRDTEKVELLNLPKLRAYTLQGLCLYLDVNTVYFNKFEEERKKENTDLANDFCKVITRIRETIYDQKFSGAASGFFNANIISRDLGLVDKQQNEIKMEQPLFPDTNE